MIKAGTGQANNAPLNDSSVSVDETDVADPTVDVDTTAAPAQDAAHPKLDLCDIFSTNPRARQDDALKPKPATTTALQAIRSLSAKDGVATLEYVLAGTHILVTARERDAQNPLGVTLTVGGAKPRAATPIELLTINQLAQAQL